MPVFIGVVLWEIFFLGWNFNCVIYILDLVKWFWPFINIFTICQCILGIIKNWIIYNTIQEFSLLNHHGIWAIMIYKNSEHMLVFCGLFIFIVVLVFYILGAFLIKQLFHSCLLDMRWLYTTRRYTPRWLSIISYPTRTHGIIVNYNMVFTIDVHCDILS